MAARLRRSLTFANVTSFLALTIAVGTGGAYAADTVFSTDIVDGEVKTVDIAASSVTNGKLAGDSVSSQKIRNGDVTNAKLAADAVDGPKIATDAVGAAEIATNAVGATEIADDSIDSGEISDDSLLAADLGANSVGQPEIASSAVTEAEIATSAVGSAEVLNNSLTPSDLRGANASGEVDVNDGIANGTCVDIPVGVSGAVVGEAVTLTLREDAPAGMLFYGERVSAGGQVIMKVCNFTGGPSPQITDLGVRVITFA